MATALAPQNATTALVALTSKLAGTFNLPDGSDLLGTLKLTAFKTQDGPPSDAQMTALLVVANQYRLNPWTKEIYAFPDKRGGIVPVVGIDGWMRIINENPQFDGIEFETNWATKGEESVTCTIYRKDRAHPTKVTEYLAECKRGTDPWSSHPKRMTRHKSAIQCARIAFGYGGIYDQDEAERIVENQQRERNMGAADVVGAQPQVTPAPTQAPMPEYPGEKFATNLPKWLDNIAKGVRTGADYVAWLESSFTVLPEQRKRLLDADKGAATDAVVKPAATTAAAQADQTTGELPAAAAGEGDAAQAAAGAAEAGAAGAPAADNAAPVFTYATVASAIEAAVKAKDKDALMAAADCIQHVQNAKHRGELQALFDNAERLICK